MTKFRRNPAGKERYTDRSDHDQCCQKQHLNSGPQHILHLNLVQIFTHFLILIFQIPDGSLGYDRFRHTIQFFCHLFHYLSSRLFRKLCDCLRHIRTVRKLHLFCQSILCIWLLQTAYCQHRLSEYSIQRISFFFFQFFMGIYPIF